MRSDALARAVVPYQAYRYLQYHLPIALAEGRGVLAKLSRHNQAAATAFVSHTAGSGGQPVGVTPLESKSGLD